MSEFGWTRLAYLSVVLIALAVLVKLGTFGAASLSENLPESVFAFNQSERAVEEQYRDDEPAEDLSADDHSEGEHAAEEHSEEEHSEEEHSEEEHSEEEHSEEEHSEEEHSEESASDGRGHSHEPVEGLYENVDFKEDAPIFYRPAPQVSSASRSPSSKEKSCETVGDAPPGSKILFPLAREYFDSYEDTWGAARPQGGHEGTDLMAPMGTPEFAITDGTVVPVSGANGNGWNTLGGYTVMIEAAYSVGPVKKGDLFYYAHMDRRSDLRIGDTVKAGDVVGYAGDTGQGPEGARGQFPPHLHLGWYETSGERTQLASGAMNPYPLLEWVKANGGSIAGGSDIPYCEAPQSSAPTPSGGGYWQFPSDPGTRPDMSTGTGTAAPSPVAEQNNSSELSPDITREPRQPARPPRPAASANPTTPATPSPPEEPTAPPETAEPTAPQPSPDGAPSPPDIPNPLPGIGDGIGEIIDGIFNPQPPAENEPTEPSTPAPPPEENPGEPPTENTSPDPPETLDDETPEPTTPPEETVPEETVPENTSVEGEIPEDEAADDEEGDECEPREHGDEREPGEEPHERDDENCSEETNPDSDGGRPPDEEATNGDATNNEEPSEETTEPDTSEAVGDQYNDGQPENEDSETISGS